jgi:mono/diheme cytochrome c family protein
VVLALCASITQSALAADDDDEEAQPGLAARYTAGDKAVDRIDRDVQFVWGAGSPDARLPAGGFSARWTGQILIRSEGKHAFHLYLQGEAAVSLNGKLVVSGQKEQPGWVEGDALALDFGEQKIEVTYRKTGDDAVLKLFWSSESFPTEPVPGQLLFHEGTRPELSLNERGRELYEAHRCQACHRRENEPQAEPAPALGKRDLQFEREWLIDWLIAPHKQVRGARMPAFGFSREEAISIAEHLSQNVPGNAPEKLPDDPDEKSSSRKGEILFRSVGCLACHTHGKDGVPSAQSGGDLTNVGKKRTAGWIDRWLKEPEKLNADHRMPVFKLADDERRSLALFLAGSRAADAILQSPGKTGAQSTASAGKKLVEAARCTACHRLDDLKTNTSGIPTLERPVQGWSKACTEAGPDPKHVRPAYTLDENERNAIRAFVESRFGKLSSESLFARGGRLLRQKGCLSCHEREGRKGIGTVAAAIAGIDPDLAGQSEALVPPNLTAIGDKLRDEPLALAIAGKQKTARLPWLKVRMPRFEHSPAESEALVAQLVGRDRIPAGAPQGPYTGEPGAARKVSDHAELRRAGQVLAGTRGFSCTACHKVGSHEPRNVALATRGSDLYLLGERMRPEFFTRWTRSPLRVIPGIEMPSYERPIAGILGESIDRQLAALWETLNDKSGAPKIDTSTIEQLLTVTPGGPAKIIRDVFNVGDALAPKFVPRAFAVGFENGENILFDLDTLSLRDHWYGGLGRQRSSGKSWFWEPGARQDAREGWDSPDLALKKRGGGRRAVVVARKEGGRFGRLIGYERAPIPPGVKHEGAMLAVKLRYVLTFDLEPHAVEVEVHDLFYPCPCPDDPGYVACERQLQIASVPEGYLAVVHIPPGSAGEPYTPAIVDSKTGAAVGRLGYLDREAGREAPAVATGAAIPQVEPVTSVPGYDGVRLPLPGSIMPTAIAWTADGTLAFCSLKGQVFLAKDTDGDGIEDKLTVFEEGLAAPYGLIAEGNDLLVAHKPELLRLRDVDGDGRADVREVVADGWGYTEDYHDWTTGILRDSRGNLYVGTGSDYAKPGRDREKAKWRGKVLRIDPQGNVTPLGHAFRYPTGLAITPDDQIFVSDNQGVQNTFNEINHLVEGASYGVPSLYEENADAPATVPAIQVPHPWTRSVNGIFFLPPSGSPAAIAGHGIGCEYDNRFLVRFTLERVGETYQGAVYPFSFSTPANSRTGFIGTLCGAVSPRGDIYIGSIQDSGWLGGANVGDIVRLRPNGKLPVGIREIRATAGRFAISFTGPIDKAAAAQTRNYDIAGYTRKWQGTYATPDSGRHKLEIQSVDVAEDGLSAVIHTSPQQPGHVYEINCGKIGPAGQTTLWPSVGHYTLNQIPAGKP